MAKVFVSYSHQDEKWKDKVCLQLGVLDEITVWDDRHIDAGDDWLPEIEKALVDCGVALLLVSVHFLNSKFILGNEVPALLRRRLEQGIRVIPVILSPCQWRKVPWLQSIQGRPTDGKALSGMSEHDADEALSALAGEIYDLSRVNVGAVARPGLPTPPERIDLTHLPEGAEHFLGRGDELQTLDAAWGDGTALVELVAPGGVGKTSLVKRWLEGVKRDGWRGARRVYGWSFFSQGSSDDRQASEDLFISEALQWFGVKVDVALAPADKGRRLAQAVAASRTLLVLDGLEPLQYPPGPLGGRLRAPGVEALLDHLASAGAPGMCVVTTRERVEDLAQYERSEDRPDGAVRRIDLGNLGEDDGARLLHRQGVRKAGAAAIAADDDELKQAGREVHSHALTLSLLGSYLADAHEGDVRRRDQVDLREADAETRGGHAFKVMAAYERWFEREGEQGARELAALRLLGFFDRPVRKEYLDVLRAKPAIASLTEPLIGLTDSQWRVTFKRLQNVGLAFVDATDGSLDAHPLVREYLADALSQQRPQAWREGHQRLYEHLKASVPHRPNGLARMQPLFQAVAHGCLAGLQELAYAEVFVDRIRRGNEFYSLTRLGAFGADLGALACFFDEAWCRPSQALSEAIQGWMLGEAARALRALGRLEEAQAPMRDGAEMSVKQGTWVSAAVSFGNLSELQLALGRVAIAVTDAQTAVGFADRSSGHAIQRVINRATLAHAQHQHGNPKAAVSFADAERMQAELQPGNTLLYSLRGFQYSDLLLAHVERAAWGGKSQEPELMKYCARVMRRGQKLIKGRVSSDSLLCTALEDLTVGRCALLAALLQGQYPDAAQTDIERAVAGLRTAGDQMYLPRGLLTRAWLRHHLDDTVGAKADLDEAWRIASRGGMKLHMADVCLYRARLFKDREALKRARELIVECEYFRRLPELEDAEAELGVRPPA